MKKGKLVEKGNHEQLLKEHPSGIYAKLVKQQEQVEDEADQVSARKSDVNTDQNFSVDSKREN